MNMKYALSSILLCFSLFCLPSCNDNETPANTPDGEEVEEVNPEKPDVPLNKNDAFQKVQKRHVQEKR